MVFKKTAGEFIYNVAKKAFKKNPNPGAAIKSVKTNVPDTRLKKLQAANRIAELKLKGARAKLGQTEFEAANKAFKKDDKFTFEGSTKKSESNKERYKRIQKENTESIKKMIDTAFAENKAKGGRVGYRLGSPKKSKLKKIQEAFKTTPSFMVKKDKPKKRLMAKKGSPDPKKKKKKFPDLTGDGKVTFADILKGRGVIKGKKKNKKKII